MPIPLVIESWIWYGFATGITLLRFVARYLNFGSFKQFQIDDYLMAVAICFYTTELVTMNIVADANTNLFPNGWFQNHQLTSEEIEDRTFGSKMVVVVEQCQIATIWLVKACLLIMYHRITLNSFRAQNIAVKILAAYVLFSFVFMEIFYFGVWCRPFHDMWAVPTPNPRQCAAAIDHLISNAVFNLSSDTAMLCIAIPMFARSNLPLQRKLVLCGMFGFGGFVIICAVLNKYYSFAHPFGNQWTYWYIRESSTAVIVANLPFTWSLCRRLCGARSFFAGNSDDRRESKVTQEALQLDSARHKAKRKLAACFGHNSSFSDAKELRRPSEMSNQPPRSQQDSLRHLASQTPASQRPTLIRGESNSSITGRSGSILGREEQLALGSWDFGADDDLVVFNGRRPHSSSHSRRSTDATMKHVYVPFRERRMGSVQDAPDGQLADEDSTPAAKVAAPIPEQPTDTDPPRHRDPSPLSAEPEHAMAWVQLESPPSIEPISEAAVLAPRRRSDDSPV